MSTIALGVDLAKSEAVHEPTSNIRDALRGCNPEKYDAESNSHGSDNALCSEALA
jgi:hypothetical protein